MARKSGSEQEGPERPRSVDPRFRLNVFGPPMSLVTSAGAGWDGALLVEGGPGPGGGEVHHDHEVVVVQRWLTPNHVRPIESRCGWTTYRSGIRLRLPGDEEYAEWRGCPRSQMLFVAPERVEAVLGKPWAQSGLSRWRDPRYQLPFVDHVLSAMMRDLEAGHPGGPIPGDALLVALLLHLDAARATPASPKRGALGRRLDLVRDDIEDDVARPLRLEELADLAGVGLERFASTFVAETGSSPQGYVLARRIARAKALLRDPKLTVAQVARAVGFADEDQLRRVFCELTGEQPGAYRQH
jgi:AraC-like DNA-binding protein